MNKKICYRCKEEKPVNQFHKDKKHKSGLRSICKTCASLEQSKNNIVCRVYFDTKIYFKYCKRCGELKHISNYFIMNRHPHAVCKECKNELKNMRRRELMLIRLNKEILEEINTLDIQRELFKINNPKEYIKELQKEYIKTRPGYKRLDCDCVICGKRLKNYGKYCHDCRKIAKKNYYEENKERIAFYDSEKFRRDCENLTDNYIKRKLAVKLDMSMTEVPEELIQFQRVMFQAKRAVINYKKGDRIAVNKIIGDINEQRKCRESSKASNDSTELTGSVME